MFASADENPSLLVTREEDVLASQNRGDEPFSAAQMYSIDGDGDSDQDILEEGTPHGTPMGKGLGSMLDERTHLNVDEL